MYLVKWVEINREYATKWPVITKKKDALFDAVQFDGIKGKFEKYFEGK